jgi:hypothetical protein
MIASVPRALALVLLLACQGCLVDARLGPNGGGMLTVRYRLDERMTLGAAAERLASPSVTVRSAKLDVNGYGTFKMQFADAQALSSTVMFKQVAITRAAGSEPGTTTFTAVFDQPKPLKLPPEALQRLGPELTVVLRLPGVVVETNAPTRADRSATWVVPIQTLLAGGKTTFSVTYRDPAPGRAAGPP